MNLKKTFLNTKWQLLKQPQVSVKDFFQIKYCMNIFNILVKEALKRFETENKCNACETVEINISFVWPPIERMDPQLGTLVKCE